jgi:CO/xanthine dehydrogenase FAD-binding subunit
LFTFNNYISATSLDEAYSELLKSKKNLILGGTSYLRMGNMNYNTAIDLSNLSLSYIKEIGDYIHIGAMTNFRDLETDPLLNFYFDGVIPNSVKSILGVQFRRNVTVGATVFSKYGFSDLITALLALDTIVVLHNFGEISLEKFLEEEQIRRDILVEIKIKKENLNATFKSIRKSKTDYAILNLALSRNANGKFRIAVGARPARAKLAHRTMKYLDSSKEIINYEIICDLLASELDFGSNLRGSEEYRSGMAKALLIKALGEVL